MTSTLPKFHDDLDPAFYQPKPAALAFLHATVTENDEKLKERVFETQKQAYAIHPFPCIGRFQFIQLRMMEHALYPDIIKLAQSESDSMLMDLGCCMGTDLRKAVVDGYPAKRLVGTDLFPEFFDAGYQLWQDQSTCGIKFVPGDVFSLPEPTALVAHSTPRPFDISATSTLNDFVGRVKYLYTGSVFHLFGEEQQADMALKIVSLLTREPGSIMFGKHAATEVKGNIATSRIAGISFYFGHSPDSWKELWKDVFSKVESVEYFEKHVVVEANLMFLIATTMNDGTKSPPGATLDAAGDETHDSFPAFSSPSTSSLAAEKAIKRARRTTVYPNINSTNKVEKPFSRSAAKRDSVMALGSIEHLQHYFTKAGLSAKQAPKGAKGFVRALGPAVPRLSVSGPMSTFDLPPSPMPPPAPPSPGHPPVPDTPSPYIADPEAMRSGVIQDLDAVESVWQLRSSTSPSPSPTAPSPMSIANTHHDGGFDVLHVLKVTTRAIRSVRNYMLALPEDHPTLHFGSNLIEAFRRHSISRPGGGTHGRRTASRPSGTPRPSILPSGMPTASSSPLPPAFVDSTPPDPSSVLRRAALDVLSVLRVLEERCRLPQTDEAYHTESGSLLRSESPVSFALETSRSGTVVGDEDGSEAGPPSTLVSTSSPTPALPRSPKPEVVPLKVQGREKMVQVWADPEEELWDDFDDDAQEKQDPWDERLVLGGGWLYRHDIQPSELEKERAVVGRYLDLVDEVVFASSIPTSPGQRGWHREGQGLDMSPRRGGGAAGDGSPLKDSNGLRKRLISTTLLDAMSEASMLTDEPGSHISSSASPRSSSLRPDAGDHQSKDVPDQSLPDWARRGTFKDDDLGRLHAFISANLPPELVTFLPPFTSSTSPDVDPFLASPPSNTSHDTSIWSASRDRLLGALSDGQILCTAYNLAVRRSRNPWGYVQLENVHDLLGVTNEPEVEQEDLDVFSLGNAQRASAKSKSSWTFRRTENLRYWAAALKLRYMISFITPQPPSVAGLKRVTEQKSTTSLSRAFNDPLATPPLVFDPKTIAAREDGWEDMFEKVLLRWLDAVVGEKRTRGPL